jgi:hypothetical protein
VEGYINAKGNRNGMKELVLAILAGGLVTYGAANSRAAQILVDDDMVQCPGAQFNSIQAAVNAAKPGDTINVCAGTYHEQVTVNKKLNIQGFDVNGMNQAIIMPTGVVANSTSTATGNPIAAIVLVDSTNGVNLSNLTIDGSGNAINGCAPNLVGVYYRNSSGMADSLAVRNIKLGSGLEGCQSGLGIFVQSGSGNQSKVTVSNCSVHDYQKNGITANEVGTNANIKGNDVGGLGATPNIAQNGIQVADGAVGTVDSNFVINHIYSPCTDANNCGAVSTNILVADSNGVNVTDNTVGNAQVNIYYQGNNGHVNNNMVFQGRVFDGIDLVGDMNSANNNSIFDSDSEGVYILGNKNQANNNSINEAPVGIFVDSPSSGTQTNGDHFFNTAMDTSFAPAMAALNLNQSAGTSQRSVNLSQP